MIAEEELRRRLMRLEQEVDLIKQQLGLLSASVAPTHGLELLKRLWELDIGEQPSLTLTEARTQLAKSLPPRWGSRQIIHQRNRL
ncbi:MAG: hypothetical protein ACUVR1_02495 [Fimbriimonadales bacterium]